MAAVGATSCHISDKTEEKTGNMEQCYDNYIVIDTGAYMTHKKYGRDLESVIHRAKEAGVQKIICVSMTVLFSKEALRLTRLNPYYIYATAGVHPHEARTWTTDSYFSLKELAKEPEIVAIGECGLDYNRNFSPQDEQKNAFEQQVKLACELKKPLFLHERDAHNDVVTILRKYEQLLPPSIVHCFTGNIKEAKTYLSMGFYIGVTGYICKDDSDNGLRALLKSGELPLDRILIQSDAPYMYPNSQSSKLSPEARSSLKSKTRSYLDRYCSYQRNEPCSVPAIVEIVGAIMGVKPEDVALATAFNSLKLFSLSS